MGFQYAGNLGGAGAPVVRRVFAAETMYVGQLVQTGSIGGLGGHVQIADAAAEVVDRTDTDVLGFVSGIVDESRTYVKSVSGTAGYGDRTTYTTTQATVLANGPAEIEMTLIIPMVTMVRAPLYDATWGTALPVLTEESGSSGGTVVTSTASAPADIADDWGTIYCRTGANRGIYRVVTTNDGSGALTVTVPFPNAIAVGDTFVAASMVLGPCRWNFPASADCIDGNNTLGDCFPGYCHQLNLEEAGKEFAIISTVGLAHKHTT